MLKICRFFPEPAWYLTHQNFQKGSVNTFDELNRLKAGLRIRSDPDFFVGDGSVKYSLDPDPIGTLAM